MDRCALIENAEECEGVLGPPRGLIRSLGGEAQMLPPAEGTEAPNKRDGP